MKEDLFNRILPALLFILFQYFGELQAQIPNYSLDQWIGSDFKNQATHFFKLQTLQLNHVQVAYSNPKKRVSIGVSVSSGNRFGTDDLSFVSGKTGFFPLLNGNIWVTPNLRLKGSYIGLPTEGDIVMHTGYGLDLFPGRDTQEEPFWMLHVQRGIMEGTDDFFMKTVGIGLFRGISYSKGYIWIGFQSDSFNAGIHIRQTDDTFYRDRLEGQINSIKLGINNMLTPDIHIDSEMSIHPSFLTFSIGVYLIIG